VVNKEDDGDSPPLSKVTRIRKEEEKAIATYGTLRARKREVFS